MTSSRISLAALVAVAVVACGGGGSGDGTGSPTTSLPGPEQPSYNDQAPPGNSDAPNNSYDGPPSSDDQPGPNPGGTPGGGGGGPPLPGGSDANCSRLCSALAAKQCDVGSPTECATDCAEGLAEEEIAGCTNEFFAFYNCLVASPAFVCLPNDEGVRVPDFEDEEALADCEPAVLALADCADLGEPEPQPQPGPGGECSWEEDSCQGCETECDACLCVLDDASLCESSCGQ